MSNLGMKDWLKAGLGSVPLAAEAYQLLVGHRSLPASGYRSERLEDELVGWVKAAQAARRLVGPRAGRRVAVFAYLQWWLEHAVALSLLLHAHGHQVELWLLPYRRWQVESNRFDDRRQGFYLLQTLQPLTSILGVQMLDAMQPAPVQFAQQIERQSLLDVQYTLQREQIDFETEVAAQKLLELRRSRNSRVTAAAYRALRDGEFESVVIPNGSILEFGAVFRTAREMGIRTVTYEFGEQRERMWLAQDEQVMGLPTRAMWRAAGNRAANRAELDQVAELYQARLGGKAWSRFARSWQRSDRRGAEAARASLGLSPDRPIALLCTNVVGDSLALDRQIFSRGMADWLEQTVRFFAARKDAQLVVRVHPGELLGAGHPSAQIVQRSLTQPSDRVTVVGPDSDINTYDLIEAAHFGLVYTSTVGMEMAMYGVPVIVSGATHYRGNGFTIDPTDLDQYFAEIEVLLGRSPGQSLSQWQIELAWRYAYLFFFEYPFAYPWHLIGFWQDLELRPFAEVIADSSGRYDRTLDALAGEPIEWATPVVEESVRA